MRLRLPVFLLFSIIVLSPLTTFAQGQGSMFDPIIPEECKCKEVSVIDANGAVTNQTSPSAPSWGCVLKVLQNGINTAVGIAILIVVLAIAYAAFIFMTRGGNPGAREQGRNVIGSSLVGLLIILGAWLGVDFIMKVVYNPSAVISGETSLGPWNAIWAPSGDSMCLTVREPEPIASGVLDFIRDAVTGHSLPQVGSSGALCPDSNPGCSPGALMSAGLTENQARAMSCIAMTESSGNPNAVNRDSKACGLFQITNKTSAGNWRQPENHGEGCSASTPCTNARCNLQTAVIMFKRSGYQPWTCNGCNAHAQACVNRYDPGAR